MDKFNLTIIGGQNHHLFNYDTGALTDGNYRGNDTQTFIGTNTNFYYNIGKITLDTRYTDIQRIGELLGSTKYQTQHQYNGVNSFTEVYNELRLGQSLNLVAGIQYENQKNGIPKLIAGSE